MCFWQVNEIAWNMTGDMFFLTTGNGKTIVQAISFLFNIGTWLYFNRPLEYYVRRNLMFLLFKIIFSGTVEVLAYPSLKAADTLMAHTAGCYCIAIDPLGRLDFFNPFIVCWFIIPILDVHLMCALGDVHTGRCIGDNYLYVDRPDVQTFSFSFILLLSFWDGGWGFVIT